MKKKNLKKLLPFCTTPFPSLPLVSDGILHGKAYWLWLQQEEECEERARVWYTKTENLYTATKPTSRGGEWQGLPRMETHRKQ